MTNRHELTRAISYRQGWDFLLSPDGLKLRVRAIVQDIHDQTKQVPMTMHTHVDPELSDDAYIKLVFETIRTMEEHESGEFFSVAGIRPFDPHQDEE